MTTSIKCRRDTTENRATTNSVLADGEFGVEKMSDGSRKLKIGDGLTTWNNLPYFENGGGGGGGLYEILDDATIDLDNLTEPKTYIYKTPCVN
jgi:hypothetical protein